MTDLRERVRAAVAQCGGCARRREAMRAWVNGVRRRRTPAAPAIEPPASDEPPQAAGEVDERESR
jgi:hypothetical protein